MPALGLEAEGALDYYGIASHPPKAGWKIGIFPDPSASGLGQAIVLIKVRAVCDGKSLGCFDVGHFDPFRFRDIVSRFRCASIRLRGRAVYSVPPFKHIK